MGGDPAEQVVDRPAAALLDEGAAPVVDLVVGEALLVQGGTGVVGEEVDGLDLLDGGLAHGHVLVAGGMNTDQATSSTEPFLKSAELFDPGTGTFSATGDMVDGQALHTGTTLQDGKVLLAGFGTGALMGMSGSSGSSPDLLSSAQLYDPASGTFSMVPVEAAPVPSTSPGTGIFG